MLLLFNGWRSLLSGAMGSRRTYRPLRRRQSICTSAFAVFELTVELSTTESLPRAVRERLRPGEVPASGRPWSDSLSLIESQCNEVTV